MIDLTATTPLNGMAPLTIGGVTLSEADPGRLTSIAPYRGRDTALSEALQAAHGMAAPAPGRTTGGDGARAVWFGRRMILLAGPAPDPALARHAALSDQSDAWATVRLEGAAAAAVLARLTPLDLRPQVFGPGDTARSELRQMMASVTRVGEASYQVMVFRGFARTLLREVRTAMEGVAARARP